MSVRPRLCECLPFDGKGKEDMVVKEDEAEVEEEHLEQVELEEEEVDEEKF